MKKSIALILSLLFIDQALKFWIKTNMALGQEFHVLGDWFLIHFTENNGMAFGIEFAGENGKVFLTLFRIVAVTLIGYYLYHLHKKKSHWLATTSIAMIFAGAMGNIIDSVFYGVLFNESTFFNAAQFLPAEGGYASLLHGKVVDMFYFPIIQSQYPDWFPYWGGQEFIFFRPVFNIADTSITTGVFMLIIFQKKFTGGEPTGNKTIEPTSTGPDLIAEQSNRDEEIISESEKTEE